MRLGLVRGLAYDRVVRERRRRSTPPTMPVPISTKDAGSGTGVAVGADVTESPFTTGAVEPEMDATVTMIVPAASGMRSCRISMADASPGYATVSTTVVWPTALNCSVRSPPASPGNSRTDTPDPL